MITVIVAALFFVSVFGGVLVLRRRSFITYLNRHRAWSRKTFGPGPRTASLLAHLRKELVEVEEDPSDVEEWIDVIILAIDGAWRQGVSSRQIVEVLFAKQTKNIGRKWPDWRALSHGEASEHIRDEDV